MKRNRWHVYEHIKKQYMNTGFVPDARELACVFTEVDPDELVEGICEFNSFVDPHGGCHV